MKIAINTRLLIDGKLDGIGWFTFHVLKNITKNHPEHTFYFIFDRPYSEKFIFSKNVIPIVVPPPTRHPVLWKIWFDFLLPRTLKKINADVFFSPDGYLAKTKIPSIAVIHDINFVHNPKDLPFFTRLFYLKEFPKYAHHAKIIATVSEFSKKDIIDNYKIDTEKIKVVYNGADDIYKPVNEDVKISIKEKYSSGKGYFVFVGSVHPRKNLKRLIIAFDNFKEKTNFEHKLIIVGAKFFKNSDLFNVFEKLKFKNDIIFTGRLEVEELHKVVASAVALAFVPYFEGFGIPILEAMYCDVPVISANITSMPEVAGDAALYVNPFNIDEISQALWKMASDGSLRKHLIEKARTQKLKFSWQKTAEKVWQAIEQINKY